MPIVRLVSKGVQTGGDLLEYSPEHIYLAEQIEVTEERMFNLLTGSRDVKTQTKIASSLQTDIRIMEDTEN